MTDIDREHVEMSIISIGGGMAIALLTVLTVCYSGAIDVWFGQVFMWAIGAGMALVVVYFLIVFSVVVWIQWKRYEH